MIQGGDSRRYINDHVGRIRRMFRWAASEELLPVAAYEALRSVEGLRKGRCGARETPGATGLCPCSSAVR